MPIDRRITNGLAWAGALLVVAIPAADAALRQFGASENPQLALIEERPAPVVAPALPTPAAERPQAASKPAPVLDKPVAPVPAAPAVAEAAPDAKPVPVAVADLSPSASGADAVDQFLQSGRPLPSYISGGTGGQAETAPAPAIGPAPEQTTATAEPETDTESVPDSESTAAVTRTRIVTFPTPVSERPAPRPRTQVAAQPPLIIETPAPVVTAADLEDWESGPLSEFLAGRQGQARPAPSDYDEDGFFLDEGPNSNARYQRFPRAYNGDFFPFE